MSENSLKDRANRALAQGFSGTNSKRHTCYTSSVPSYVVRGEKCYLFDEQNKRYLDFVSGLGTNLLGYDHPKVRESVSKALSLGGPSFSFPHPLEIEVAEKIQQMIPCAEKVRFLKNGDDATCAAIRIARANSVNKRVISSGYHGRSDLWTSLTPPANGVYPDSKSLGIHSVKQPDGLESDIGILEPIELNMEESKTLLPVWRGLQILIFDEIVTGFRLPKYCAANYLGVRPNLICLGKALGNGFPISVVAGDKDLMDEPTYFISSTFSGEIMGLAAAKAVLEELERKSLDDLLYYAQRFQARFNNIMQGLTHLSGYGTRCMMELDSETSWLVQQEAARAGIILGKAFFYNFAHMEEGIEEYALNILSDIANNVRSGSVKLDGPAPAQTFKR